MAALSAGARGRSDTLTVAAGAVLRGVTVNLEPTGTVRGLVVVPDGDSPAGGVVSAPGVALFWEPEGTATPVAADGSFVLAGLPAGFLRLEAWVPGYPPESAENVRVPGGGVLEGVRIEMEPGLTFRGRVVRTDGTPLEGAEIRQGGAVVARTDAAGRFAVRGFDPGSAGLEASREGYRTRRFRYRDPTKEPYDEEVVLELAEARALTGRVLAEDGTPLAGLEVRAFSTGAGGNVGATMADGVFRILDLPVGPLSVPVAGAPSPGGGWQPTLLPGVEEVPSPVEIRLKSGLRICGRVTGPDDGPVEGAEVSIRYSLPGARDEWNDLGQCARSDPDGRFALSGLPPGEFDLHVYAKGFPSAQVVGVPAGREDLEVAVGGGLSVRGRVLGPSEEAIAQARVELDVEQAHGGMRFATATDTEGRFAFEGLPQGSLTLRILPREGPAPAMVTNVAPAGGELVIRLTEGLAVSGVLCREDGRPLAGVKVGAGVSWDGRARSGVTGEDGRFRIAGFEAGSYPLALSPDEDGYRLKQEASAEAGGAEVRLVAVEAPSVAGVVVDRDGNPVRATVYLAAAPHREVRTVADGKFRFLGVSDGEVGIVVWGPESQWVRATVQGGDQHVVIRLP